MHPAHPAFDAPVTCAAILAALLYTRGWFVIRRTFPHAIATPSLAAFLIGVLAAWIAVGSPLVSGHHELLSIHMVQHVLLMAVAPPLILIGAPTLPLLYGLPWRSVRRTLGRLLHRPLIRSIRQLPKYLVLCWLAPVVALIGWHVPAVFELSVRSRWWHDVQAASFFVTGALFWAPVVRWPPTAAATARWLIPLYLFAATLPCDALSAFLVFCDRVVYTSYLSGPRLWNISPLHDQECAGALMWVSVTLIYLVPAVAVTIELLTPPLAYRRYAAGAIAPLPSADVERQGV